METSISRRTSANSRKRNMAGKPTAKSSSARSARPVSARAPSRPTASSARVVDICSTRTVKRRLDALIVDHLPLVVSIAERLAMRLPKQVEVDDLVSAGHVGLCEAARGFDASRGVPFGAFARRRIVGSMLDHLRDMDPLSRKARARVRAGLMRHFEVQLHLDDPVFVRANGLAAVSDAARQDAALTQLLEAAHVRTIVAKLPLRERFVVEHYFWQHQSLTEIGVALGVGEARASQLKTQACHRLHRWLSS